MIKFTVRTGSLGAGKEAVILGLTEGTSLPSWSAGWPASWKKAIQALLKSKQFHGKLSETFILPVDGRWLFLVGAGKKEELTLDRIRQAAGTVCRRAAAMGVESITRGLVALPGSSVQETAQALTEGTILGTYRYNEFKAKSKDDPAGLKSVTVVVSAKDAAAVRRGVGRGQIVAEAACWTRDLGNRPSNRMTPTMLAREAQAAAKKYKFRCRVLGPAQQKRLGMNALLGVARGSREPSQFIILEYKGPRAAAKKPLLFIGKGITFDSGGISIKPSSKMEEMKFDMCGGAAVLGAFRAVAGLKLPVHLVGLVPATENLPGGSAQKPGDVVRAIGGKTIEVINTDAEGRLVLADALGYARRFYKPAAMIDLATLTGACVVALGSHCSGLMGNNSKWNEQVKAASNRTHERAWELPLWPEYTEAVKSGVADVQNVGDGKAGTITAAAFLQEFAGKEIPWVHLDIAGTAWADGDKGYIRKGGTGVGVRLLVDLASHWKGKV